MEPASQNPWRIWRPYVLGILGLAFLTFPFLWLQLAPNFALQTTEVTWAPWHGLEFFGDLSPVFFLVAILWAANKANRHFGWSRALTQTAAWNRAGHFWNGYWSWTAMAVVLVSTFFLSSASLDLFTTVGIFMLLAIGLNITVGMTGLLVLGYAGFYGFGAYFFGVAQANLPFFPWWLAAPLAFFLGGAAGWLLGLPCLRLRGDYLAIVTLGFAEAFRKLMSNLDVTGGEKGINFNRHATFQGFAGLHHAQVGYLMTALILFLAVFLIQRLFHSPVGRAWVAIRENEIAAGAVGVPVVRMKLLAFSLSAAIASVAGVIYAATNGFIDPSVFNFQTSIQILAMVILGGLGNSYGALLGAALLYLVPEYLKLLPSAIEQSSFLSAITPPFLDAAFQHLSDYRWLLFGGVMVVMMLYRPQGLLGSSRRKTEMRHP
jgi:branched-chain amino acid transport system permease protein